MNCDEHGEDQAVCPHQSAITDWDSVEDELNKIEEKGVKVIVVEKV